MGIAPGRRALITGGASGFGKEIARRVIGAGGSAALVDLSRERLEAAVAELGDRACAFAADVSSPAQIRDAVAQAEQTLGGLDTLVLAAGVIHLKEIGDVTEADWDLTLDVNLKGAFFAAQAAAPALRASGRGRIVTISSETGRRGFPWLQAYSASKFGLVGLTESLAVELAADAVTVNCICPISVPTTGMGRLVMDWKLQRSDKSEAQLIQELARAVPLGRNPTEADIAEAALYFISDEASFMTGVTVDVDGGARIGAVTGA